MKLAVVVLAAGKGTRMKSERAKVLHEVAGRPMIEYPVLLARALEAERVICVLGHQADDVRRALDARFGEGAVEVALQTEQRGTGHAVLQAMPALAGFEGRVLILYGDVPLVTRDLLTRLVEASRDATLGLVTLRLADPTGYGRVVRGGPSGTDGGVRCVVEHKDATAEQRAITEVNAGLYCVDAAFLRPALAALSPDNAQGELYLTDVVARAAGEGTVASVEAVPEDVMGINDRVELARADAILRGRVTAALMRSGVTIRAPETCFIDHGVEIGADSEIGPLVHLRGRTRLGAGCTVDAGCVVTDAALADGVHLKPYTVVSGSAIAEGATIGPFAHLRPGSDVGPDVKIGNFVETKKARFGRGSKASHLSYLGDAEIGADVNIGCGTITCNYDGYRKYVTVIEDGAFIGSDTQLVAPVRVGRDAVIGSGTTVTEDVSPGALALSRAPQIEKRGYAEKRREREAARKAQQAGKANDPPKGG